MHIFSIDEIIYSFFCEKSRVISVSAPKKKLSIIINRFIAAFCANMTITGAFSAARLLQNQQDKPGYGEGLAEALEVDAL